MKSLKTIHLVAGLFALIAGLLLWVYQFTQHPWISQAGTISANRDYQNKYLDQTFWDDWLVNRTTGEVVRALFSSNSIYTKFWTGNMCNPATMNEVYVYALPWQLPMNLAANTVYVLQSWNHYVTWTNSLNFIGNCTALVSEGWANIIYSGAGIFFTVIDANTYSSTHLIIDNISVNSTGSTSNWLTIGGNNYNITVNNSNFYNWVDWILLQSHTTHNVIIDNSRFYNNSSYWLEDLRSFDVVINNSQSFNNTQKGIYIRGFATTGTRNLVLNNTQSFNNGWNGIELTISSGIIINNVQSYNNNWNWIYLNGTGNFNNRIAESDFYNNAWYGIRIDGNNINTYHGNNNIFFNSLGSVNGQIVQGWYPILGLSVTGTLDTSNQFMNCSWVTNPTNASNQSFFTVTTGNNGCNTKWVISRTPTSSVLYTFYNKIRKQVQPLKYSSNTIAMATEVPYSSFQAIGDPVMFGWMITLSDYQGTTVTQTGWFTYQNSNITQANITTNASATYTISWDSTANWSVSSTTSTPITRSSDGVKLLTARLTNSIDPNLKSNIYGIFRGVLQTTTLDLTPPVITISGPASGTGFSKSVSATMNEGGTIYSYVSFSSTCNSSISTGLFSTYTAGSSLTFSGVSDNGKYICFKAIDSAGNITFSGSAQIAWIVADTSAPVITINNPNTVQEANKTISASLNENGTLAYSVVSTSVCDGSLGFTSGASVSFSSPLDNGKRVCFRAFDTAWNGPTYALSNQLQNITGNPLTIVVYHPGYGDATYKTISAAIQWGIGSLFMAITSNNYICDSSLSFVPYYDLTFSSTADNGKRVCYKAVDLNGIPTYKLSDPIQNIVTTTNQTSYQDYCPYGDNSPSRYDGTCNSTTNADYCPYGDNSPSRYDGTCNSINVITPITPPVQNGTLSCDNRQIVDIGNSSYQTEIEKLIELCVVKGFPDATFRPNERITIGQFITMLVRLLTYTNGFDTYDYKSRRYYTDVRAWDRYAPYINWAYEQQLMWTITKFGRTGLKYANPNRRTIGSQITSILKQALRRSGKGDTEATNLVNSVIQPMNASSPTRGQIAKVLYDLFNLGSTNPY